MAYHKKYCIENLQEHAKSKQGKCFPVQVKLKWLCGDCNKQFETTLELIEDGHWCGGCFFKTETKVREIFEKVFKEKFIKIRPEWLRNPNTGSKLELDGYCKKLKIAFEYQGQHHYQAIFNNQVLADTQKRDQIKVDLCKQRGVFIFKVSYRYQLDKLEAKLKEYKKKFKTLVY